MSRYVFMSGKHTSGGWWVVFGKTRRFRIDWGAYYEEDGWCVRKTRIVTWNRNAIPLKFRSKIFVL